MSFFDELRRRNVFRVGIAYTIGAWILVQVADILLETFGAPGWTMQFIVVVLIIGFPLAVFFAWAFELTPEGVKREAEVDRSQSIAPQTGKKLNNAILVLMALAIAYLLFDKFSATDSAPAPAVEASASVAQQGAEPAAEPAINRKSIAVLPFQNRSPDPADEFFTEGIHDDLLSNLARIGSLKVISRTSVAQYKDTEKTIPVIAGELGVANIMEGAVQRAGNQVRINVQLIDAQTDEHLWAEIFDRELTAENLFAIQTEISTRIAQALETALSPQETEQITRMPTENLAAYDDYLRARQLVETRNSSNLKEAQGLFRSAVEADPDFALAWVGLADATDLMPTYGTMSVVDSLPIRREAIDRALALDPDLGEAYASLGMLLLHQDEHGNREQAEAAFQRAIELSPGYARAYHWYANSIREITRAQDKLDLARKAQELDPRSAIITSNLASAYVFQGLYSLAEQQFLKNIELNPDFAHGHRAAANFYASNIGRIDRAVEFNLRAQALDPGSVFVHMTMAMHLMELGLFNEAERYRDAILELNPQDWRAGMADLMLNNARANNEAVRETWNWLKPRAPNYGFIPQIAALTQLAAGDTAGARATYLEAQPEWTDPDEWDRLIDINTSWACLVGWTFVHTGDEPLGKALLEKSVAFMDALPAYVEHADWQGPDICYLATGQAEKALDTIETQLAHNHLLWMELYTRLPMYESIRHEPRYQAVLAERERRLAAQRQAVTAMLEEAGP